MKIFERLLNKLLMLDLQTRPAVGFLIAACLTGFVVTLHLIGTWTINRSTMDEVENRVRRDIHTANLIYEDTRERIVSLVRFHAEGADLTEEITGGGRRKMQSLKDLIRNFTIGETAGEYRTLDMLSVLDMQGKVLYGVTNPGIKDDSMLWDPVVRKCIETGAPQSSTELMPLEKIIHENPLLVERVTIDIFKTPHSKGLQETELSKGMVIRAAHPIRDKNQRQIGVLVGGLLLSRDPSIVDKIGKIVSHDERYGGREVGIAAIVQGRVLISTNARTNDDRKAIGTALSTEAYDRAITEGKEWVDRAPVMDDWYITTCKPIYNIDREPIGMLCTGILDAKYRNLKWRMIWINLGITVLGMVIGFFIWLRMSNTIIRRIRILKKGTEAIASGNLDYRLRPDKISGFDLLDEAFNDMTKSLKDRDERLQKAHEQLKRSEKFVALGEMAAGVAHEINNPLGGILLYSNLVMEDVTENGAARENIRKIIHQTNRCKDIVRGLLDFARAPIGEMLPLQINDIVRVALNLVKDQAMFHGVRVETRFAENLGKVMGDPARLEQVFLNLFINAADAMKEKGGRLKVTTTASGQWVKAVINDTGKGIDEAHLPHIFEPFFTTKGPGRGTGLGLSIVYGVIRRHNGFIDAESATGKGTTFTVSLPFAPDEGSGTV